MSLLFLAGCEGETTEGPDRPNVLFIMTDDMNVDLQTFGHPVVQSPHLDRLAARGLRLMRAYCQVPICNPSRVSLLSGLRPERTGVYTLYEPTRQNLPETLMLPEYFRKHGYFTAQVGKIFHTGEGHEDPRSWDVEIRESGKFPRPGEIVTRKDAQGPRSHTMYWATLKTADAETPDGIVARRAARLLRDSAGEGRPFFLGVGFRRPHAPFSAPRAYFDLYPPSRIVLPETPPEHLKRLLPAALNYDYGPPEPRLSDREKQEFIAAYYACNTYVDAQVGVLLDTLDELDLWRKTIVVFVSDHGYHLADHGGLWHKNSLFERSARVPLIIAAPGRRAAGATSTRLVEMIDLYPTLVELAGLPLPDDLDGRSLVPLLDDPQAPVKEAAYTLTARGADPGVHVRDVAYLGRSVRTKRWRYSEWDGGKRGRELYDHREDPKELVNLAEDPTRAATVRQLSRLLSQVRKGRGK